MVGASVVVVVCGVADVDGVAVLLNVAVVGEVELVCKTDDVEENVRVVTASADVDDTSIAKGFAVVTNAGLARHDLVSLSNVQASSARQSRGTRPAHSPSGCGVVVVTAAAVVAFAAQLLPALTKVQPSFTRQSFGVNPVHSPSSPSSPSPSPSPSLAVSPSPSSSPSPSCEPGWEHASSPPLAAQLFVLLSKVHSARCRQSGGASPAQHPVGGGVLVAHTSGPFLVE